MALRRCTRRDTPWPSTAKGRAAAILDRDVAVIGYFGDGATSQGDVNEAFIFASSYNAPIVFFCQNNQWAISEPIERQSRIPLYGGRLASASPVSGWTATMCSRCTRSPLAARSGPAGRQWALVHRGVHLPDGAHTTSDDPTKYRLADEHWRLKDPIERVRAYLSRTGRHHDGFFAEVDAEAADYASELRARCLALPEPHMLDMFDLVYAEQTPFLAAQKVGYADYLESFEGADMVDGPSRLDRRRVRWR